MGEVVHISKRHPSGQTWTPEQLLEELLKELKAGTISMTVISAHWFTKESSGRLRAHRWQSGCSSADELLLLEAAKAALLEDLRE